MARPTSDRGAQEANQERIEEIGEQLRAKISSKFQVSSVLAGLAATMLSVQVAGSDGKSASDPVSTSLTLASLILYIAAIIHLDSLSMPKRFWPEGKSGPSPVSRLGYLTDEDLWALKDSMVFHWTSQSLLATVLLAVSVIAMLAKFSMPSLQELLSRVPQSAWAWSFVLTLSYLALIEMIGRKRFGRLLRPQD